MEQLVNDCLEPCAALQFVVDEDAWPLGVVKVRPPCRVARQLGETEQPPLAVDCDVVILGHASRVAGVSTVSVMYTAR